MIKVTQKAVVSMSAINAVPCMARELTAFSLKSTVIEASKSLLVGSSTAATYMATEKP